MSKRVTSITGRVPGGDIALPSRDEIAAYHLMQEGRLVEGLKEYARFSDDEHARISQLKRRLVQRQRVARLGGGGIDDFLGQSGLSRRDGIIVFCVGEALLEIPDRELANKLIGGKIGDPSWDKHLNRSGAWCLNAAIWALMLSGRVAPLPETDRAAAHLADLIQRIGESATRHALLQAMKIITGQFVAGRCIDEALANVGELQHGGARVAIDMLGPEPCTDDHAARNFACYRAAIERIGSLAGGGAGEHVEQLMKRPAVSIRLSALHPRYEAGKQAVLDLELVPKVVELAVLAREKGVPVSFDAEEQNRLDLSLDVFAQVFCDPRLGAWQGVGLTVQAYGRRALPVLRWLRDVSRMRARRIPVRLVKGAYWRREIEHAQRNGLADYPVFTCKAHSELSYLACMRFMFSEPETFYPQLATHDAGLVAAAMTVAGGRPFEFQRLLGWGDGLYRDVGDVDEIAAPCRICAPVGDQRHVVDRLAERVLQNADNAALSNQCLDQEQQLAVNGDCAVAVDGAASQPGAVRGEPELALPGAFYGASRANSAGFALYEGGVREKLLSDMGDTLRERFDLGPRIHGRARQGEGGRFPIVSPHDHRRKLGAVRHASSEETMGALGAAMAAQAGWNERGGDERADLLVRGAQLYEAQHARLMAVLVREAGMTLIGAHREIRAAVDLLRYYAEQTRRLFGGAEALAAAAGERREFVMQGHGPFACISPWNAPLSAFTGQVAAALGAGNVVLAKPAHQTPITALLGGELLHEAGVARDVLQLLPGHRDIGAQLVGDERVCGVCLTGTHATAKLVQRALVERQSGPVPFVAQTGGPGAAIVDSTVTPENVVREVITSAFNDAGQRCGATRVVFVANDVAERVIAMLAGAAERLTLGDPLDYATDVGPVIDGAAQERLEAHKARMQREAKFVHFDGQLSPACANGTFVSPAIYELHGLDQLPEEIRGPILHVVRYDRDNLVDVCDQINASGYRLKVTMHTRSVPRGEAVCQNVRAGQVVVRRDRAGRCAQARAMTDGFPFGGGDVFGVGAMAGGPNYLARFGREQVVTRDVFASSPS